MMRRRVSFALALVGAAGLTAVAVSCAGRVPPATGPVWPLEVETALQQAGAQRGELEAVLRDYRSAGDSLALASAEYLIANMASHCYAILSLCDSLEQEIPLDVLARPDYESLRTVVDSIEAQRGELTYRRTEIRPDLETLTGDLLRENVDLALRAWRERPWARHLSFADFRDYVLPHRGSNEPIESWRPWFLERYADLPARMQDPTDPIEAARRINADLMDWFRFDARFYLHPTDQGLGEMRAGGLGRCEDMTNLAIYAMRANGLAVTSDYTPFWANSGNNHAWNAILDRDGRVLSFMGCEAHPGEYRLSNRLAKAYRKTYAAQPRNLAFQRAAEEKVPSWLDGKYYTDVTAAYGPVAQVEITLDPPVPDSVHFAYLCVFNSGRWEAIDWSRIADGRAAFRDVGVGIVYLPATYVNEQIVPAGAPFVLEESGASRPLRSRLDQPQRLRLTSTTQAMTVADTDGVRKTHLDAGRAYELFHWDGRWVSLGSITASGEPLEFDGVPAEGLYWLVAEDSHRDERIFTYEAQAQLWW